MRAQSRCIREIVATMLVAALAGGWLAAAGCHSSGPPRPWGALPAVNAALRDHVPVYVDRAADGDARVVARCRGCEEFWKTRRGDWEYTWVVARFDVLTVERGSWPDPTLSFVCWDAWPTIESGIMVYKHPWPYRKDVTLAFDLDTTQHPARVIGQVVRYDPLVAPITRPTVP